MKHWKVIIDHENVRMTITIEAQSYPDAYVKTGLKYPGCTIVSISEIRNRETKRD